MSAGSESDDFASAESDTEEQSAHLRGTEAAERDEGKSKVVDNSSTLKTSSLESSSLESPPVNEDSGGNDVDSSEIIEKDPAKPCDKIEPNSLHSPPTEDTHLLSSSLPEEINTTSQSATVSKTTVTESSTVSKQTPPKIMSVGAELGLLTDVVHEREGGGGWGGWGDWGSSLWSSVSTVAESAQAIGQKVTSAIATVENSLGVPSPQELVERSERDQVLEEKTRQLAENMVEHDVSQALVNEEPHSLSKQGNTESGSEEQTGEGDGEEGTSPGNVAETMSSFFSGFATVIQTTGQGFVSGGLDALETLGKKTMEVLSEGDPGLTKKRAMLSVGVVSSSLSQLLREAKAEGLARAAMRDGGGEGAMDVAPLNYSRLFDEYHGVGHLEALELLSKECVAKSRSMLSELSEAGLHHLQGKLEELTEAFAVDEDQSNLEDDTCQLAEMKPLLSSTSLPIKSDKLLKVSSCWRQRVDTVLHQDRGKGQTEKDKEGQDEGETGEGDDDDKENHEKADGSGEPGAEGGAEQRGSTGGRDKKITREILYENGLRSLAELTSASIELFRKIAEICLLPEVAAGEPLFLAQTFNRLMVLLLNELDALASVHSEGITELDVAGTNSSVTSLYLESSNSGSYVQDAFQLLLPVLKVVLVQEVKVQQPAINVINRN